MAASQAANIVEKVVGHNDNATVTTDVSNYNKGAYGQETGEKIKATTWQGKNSVQIVEMPKPRVVDEGDVIVKVTGSTICGSDLHLYHGVIPQLEKGDVLGHEFCGVVESVGPTVKKVKAGDRVVAAFPIACGECRNCKEQLTSACERTNENSITNAMYGKRTAGMFGYSHFTGGFAGGQAEYMITAVRPFGRIGVTGVYAGYTNHFNIGALMQTGIRFIGNGQAPVQKYWEHLLELIRRQEINPLDMVTHRVSLENMPELYAAFERRDKGMQKVYVQTRFSSPPAEGSPQLTEL
ncbi:hypothetical protein AFLA_012030 [Aspergillus flavus NRRL3357]|nr:hypothetical protein AFLA_012030 [Aspergillus flavus NRRL3357]